MPHEMSLDPRVNRINLPQDEVAISQESEGWLTYEVFHQKKSGAQHTHAGIVHAPNDEMALVLAKEQFSRRGATTSLWIVPSSAIISTAEEDSEMFDTTPGKLYREASEYKVRDRIENFQNHGSDSNEDDVSDLLKEDSVPSPS